MKLANTICLLFLASWFSLAAQASTVLVETEAFSDLGGWKVDTQASEQMGSPYVLAHGMGVPVLNATTTVAFPAPGTYSVWVRTRNWVPDFTGLDAPGRFKVLVDGGELAPQFGTNTGAWHWESGGDVTVGTNATLTLVDLTGFDGRCDAIAFLQGGGQPPESGPELAAWRQAVLNESPTPPETRAFDCVVVGGGVAGCCAAVSAARGGLTVALVNDRPFLGGNASQEIQVAPRGEPRHSLVVQLGGLDTAGYDAGADARRLSIVQAEPNITLFMPSRAYGAGTGTNGRIMHVDVRHVLTGARTRLEGTFFIDCTGDGWVGYWAGADYRMGREALSEFNETLGIPTPLVADAKTLGSSVMWSSANGSVPVSFPAVPWAMAVAGTRKATSGGWEWEYGLSLNTITDAEQIRDHLLRAIYGNFYNAKQDTANTNRYLTRVAYVPGKRESRRLMGDHILIESDIRNHVYFGDEVGTATWGIDLHYETDISYLTWYNSTAVGRWYFPFRCLYSRNVPNLMMAGRNISVSHVGLGSPRVMNTGGQMGVAVGYAAALCKRYGIEPRDIYRSAGRTRELKNWILAGVINGTTWPQPPSPVTSLILDNSDAAPGVTVTGDWTVDTAGTGYYGTNFLQDGNSGQGAKRVAYTPALTLPGQYSIALRWPEGGDRATNVPVWILPTPEAQTPPQLPPTFTVNQQTNGGQWMTLGGYDVPPECVTVIIGNDNANGTVVADAVRFLSLTASTADSDSDGLPDSWELYYFKSETGGQPDGDADDDLYSNYYEFSAGTDPLDFRSIPNGPPPAPSMRVLSPPGRLVTLAHTNLGLRVQVALVGHVVSNLTQYAWRQVSGPGPITFDNASATDTTARFSTNGLHVLECTASNASGSATAQITVAVNAPLTLSLREGINGCSHLGTLIRGDGTYTTMNAGARDLMIIGKTSAGLRALFSYDLSALQPDVSIQSATLDFWTSPQAGSGSVGVIELHPLNSTPVEGVGDGLNASVGAGTGATWVSRDGQTGIGHYWTNAGGDFSATVLSTVPGYNATNINLQKTFPSTSNFTGAVQAAVSARQPLNLLAYAPATETNPVNNQYTRISSDDYTNADQRPLFTLGLTGNYAPVVACGPVPAVTNRIAAVISGTATNPGSGVLATCWRQIAGPGACAFASTTQLTTSVTFDQPGDYHLQLGGSNAAGEASAVLPVTVLPNENLFADWQKLMWPGVTDPAIVGAPADPDHDGIVNMIEFALHLSPNTSGTLPITFLKNGEVLEFTYLRRRAALEIAYRVEWTDSLAPAGWSTNGVAETVLAPDTDPQIQSVLVSVPAGSGDQRFLRLQVIQP